MAKLVKIKDFNEHWYNNGNSTSFAKPYGANSKFGKCLKTPMAVDCLDNRRRRVYMDNDIFSYILYVFMGGEKCVLCDPVYHTPVSMANVGELITKDPMV